MNAIERLSWVENVGTWANGITLTATDRASIMLLRAAGCVDPRPLLGVTRNGAHPRCRLCRKVGR